MIKNYKKYITESKEDDKIYLDITDMVKDYLDIFIPTIQEKEYDEVPNWIINKPNFIELLKKI